MEQTAVAVSRPHRLPIVALLAANALSLVGSALTAIALPWFVLQTTGSAARTGLTAFAVVLPAFVAGILGGTLVDRLGYRRVSVLADLVGGLGIALVPLLHQTIGLPFWGLLVLVFLGSLLEIPGLTARRAMLPELAALAGLRLERVNAWFEANQQLALLLGPPAAGLLIAWLGTSQVLWVDAATFVVSAAVVAAAVPVAHAARVVAGGRYWGDLAAGLRFLRRDRLLLALAATLLATNCLAGPLFAVLLPVYADRVFGRATALGLAFAAAGGGALLGALAFGAVGHRLPRRATWLVAFLVAPAQLWILALSPSLPLLVVTLALVGVIGGGINPLLVTVRHERIPAAMRGRVFGTFSAIAMGAEPLGMLLAGFLIEAIGFRPTVLILAAGAQTVGFVLLFVPALREMDASRPARVG